MRKSVDVMNMKNRQERNQDLVSENNAFIRRQQEAMKKYAGKTPKIPADMYGLQKTSVNTAENAERLTDKLLAGWDKVAFPRK